MIIERIGDQTITNLIEQSTLVARVLCAHAEWNLSDAEITRIYRSPAGTAPYDYLLSPSNTQRVFDDSRPVTLVSRIYLVGSPDSRKPAHWEIACQLCERAPRIPGEKGSSRYKAVVAVPPLKLKPANLAALAEGLLAANQAAIELKTLRRQLGQ